MADTISTLAAKLRPHWLRDVATVTTTTSGGAVGVTDHGALSGLFDDDHTQYLTAVRGDARYLTASRNIIAGAGLTGGGALTADVTLNVGAGLGIDVNADDIALTTPGTLTVSSTNSSAGSHTHAITSSSNPGAAASILASSAAGLLTLYNGAFTQAASSAAVFASGFAGSGWRADYGVTTASRASIETDDLTVRGRMRVYELLIQQIRASNGSVFVSSSSKVVSVSTSTNPLWTVNGVQLTFNGANATFVTTLYTISTAAAGDTARELYHGFLYGDLVRAQQVQWNGTDFGGVIQSNLEVTSVANLYTYGAALVSGDAPAVSYDYVRLGNSSDTSRQGSVYLTADDSAAPFIDIVDGVYAHTIWNSAGAIKARLGKLSGISDVDFGGALSGYGLYSDNVYLKGNIYATSGQFTGTVYANAGSFTGTVTAASGSIGGWRLGATSLTAGSGATTVGLDSGGTNPALYAGSATPASAPFRVTNAGALTATSASITGSLGATGGGVISGNWYVGYDVSYAGSMYFGSGGKARVGTNGMSLVMEHIGSVPDIPTASSALRWLPDISEGYTHTNAKDYSGLVGYRHSGNLVVDNIWTSFVGSTNYATYAARVMLQAGHHTGAAYTDARLEVVREAGTGQRYVATYGDKLQVEGFIHLSEISTVSPNPPGNTLYIYARDNGAGKTQLLCHFSDGTITQLAIQP
jgi:hypothetical protein